MNDTTECFWLVWNPARSMPERQHPTFHLARAEAGRLAKRELGESFYVLRVVGVARKCDVEYKRIEPSNDQLNAQL